MLDIVLLDKNYKKNLIGKIVIANSFFKRFIGLMLRKELNEDENLLLTNTKQIHTFWMNFSIDVIYLKKFVQGTYIIIGLEKNLKPWSIGVYHSKASDVLELSEGMIDKYQIKVGDMIKVQNKFK